MGTGFLLAAYLYVNDCGQRKRPELLFYTGSRGERVCVKEFIFVAVGQRDRHKRMNKQLALCCII